MYIYHIIVSKFLQDCNERFQTVFFMFCSILVFWKRNSECYSNRSEKPSNMESPWNVLKIYVSKALGLLNKNLVILGAPQQRNCLLPTSKVCSQIHDSESHKPAFSSTSLNCRSLKQYMECSQIYMSKDLGLLNKYLVILGAPKQRNCLLPASKVCFQVHDSESHKPAFSSTS